MAKQKIKESNPMSVQKGEAVFCYIIMAIVCLIALFPIVWVVISSFKADLLAEPGFSLPSQLCFDGYIRLLQQLPVQYLVLLCCPCLLTLSQDLISKGKG